MSGPQGHSSFGASSSARWIACPGSVQAQSGMENKSSAAAEEGTFLHAVTEHALRHDYDANVYVGNKFNYDDHGKMLTRILDIDQADAVQLALDTVRADCERLGATSVLEQRFHLTDLDPDFYGTCDCVLVKDGQPLAVIDYKFGRGLVDIRNERGRINSQIGYYAIGAGALAQQGGVECAVIQPRAYHPEGPVRRTYASHAELQKLADTLVRAARLARQRFAPRTAGDHCKFCRAAATCAALQRHVMSEASALFDGGSLSLPSIPGSDIPRALSNARLLRTWIDAVEEHAISEIEAGKEVKGWELRPKRAVKKWKDEDWAEHALYTDIGLDKSSIREYKLKSVAQVEKLLKGERLALAALKQLYTAESSGHNLVKAEKPHDH